MNGNNTKVKLLLALVLGLMVTSLRAQGPPVIRSFTPQSGSMNDIITINGNGFGTDASKRVVTFGSVKGSIVSINDQMIEVRVPAGARYAPISVTNTDDGLTGYSQDQFLLNFVGDEASNFDPANLATQADFPTTTTKFGLYDLCMCDFDGDGRVDVATANKDFARANIYLNTSPLPRTVSFDSPTQLNLLLTSIQVKCGDLNGDGKPDLVFTEASNGNNIRIFKNQSTVGTLSFAPFVSLTPLTDKGPLQIEIADLDNDGKAEIITTSQSTNNIIILKNISTTATIQFEFTPIFIPVTGPQKLDGLSISDLNGDRLPDIVTSEYLSSNSNIYVLKNTSIQGSISMAAPLSIPANAAVKNLRVGDVDGDGKTDIAYSQLGPSFMIGVALNQSSSSSISFGTPQGFVTDGSPWGLDMGDLNGDGKVEIVSASITKKSLTIFSNASTPGNISFKSSVKTTTFINRQVNIGDVDNDGKPDIVFTSIDDGNTGVIASKISVFRNKTCMVPEVTPEGPINICNATPDELVATAGGGVTYQWQNLTNSTSTAGGNTFVPSTLGANDYQVQAISEGGACTTTSNTVRVTLSTAAATTPTSPQSNSPVCIGQPINLSFTPQSGAGFSYRWTGPDNFTSTSNSPTVSSASLAKSGKYFVEVYFGDLATGCLARKDSTIVTVTDVPDFFVDYKNDVICAGPSTLESLQASPILTGYVYNWFKDGVSITPVPSTTTYKTLIGGTPSYTGNYYFTATGPCPAKTSNTVKISVVNEPVVDFTLPAEACKGQEITIVNNSVADTGVDVYYSWNFGDGKTSTEKDPKKTYTNIGASFTVTLKVAYKNDLCAKSAQKNIQVTAAPTLEISNVAGLYDLCPGASIPLEATSGFSSYAWNTGASGASITASAAGTYSVEATATNGCLLKASRIVGAFPAPTVVVTATPEQIETGATVQLEASGINTFLWAPEESLSDIDIANPVATPQATTTYTVTGKDANNCEGSGSVTVKVKGQSIISKLGPKNFFSPGNGDAFNNQWTVDEILNYPQCGVTIYDDKGVKVFSAKPYQNDWDGTFNGKPLPPGVYYFIIRCDGDEGTPRSGSITLLR